MKWAAILGERTRDFSTHVEVFDTEDEAIIRCIEFHSDGDLDEYEFSQLDHKAWCEENGYADWEDYFDLLKASGPDEIDVVEAYNLPDPDGKGDYQYHNRKDTEGGA